jgi:hypothetical protein
MSRFGSSADKADRLNYPRIIPRIGAAVTAGGRKAVPVVRCSPRFNVVRWQL